MVISSDTWVISFEIVSHVQPDQDFLGQYKDPTQIPIWA